MKGLGRLLMPLVLTTILAPVGMTATAAELQLLFEADRIVAEGLSPGADAVWLGVEHGSRRWQLTVHRIDRLLPDTDQDGRVELLLPDGVPQHSVWAVVDAFTGLAAIATPSGPGPPPVEIAPSSLVPEGTDPTGVLLTQRRSVEVLLVEPGLGIWRLTAGDGAMNDSDGVVNGELLLSFGQMRQLFDSGPAPQRASGSASLVVIDALTLAPAVITPNTKEGNR